ncbi:ADP-ribosylation factor 2-like isoform X2 [Mytilus galloprovincialis]|uniref:ADP-ribosylation factor 2-like isoform X2 n=1 Tax=Mytilus galloprovincialis TaxID=29158 RepID=UPI003F7C72D7
MVRNGLFTKVMGQAWNKISKYRSKEIRILLLGLESVGKTTLLYRLKLGEPIKATPTIGFNVESFQYKDLSLNAWDLGFGGKMRPLCQHYYKGSNAVVIMIDRGDRERLEEVTYDVIKPALKSEDLKDAVFLFLANKSDIEDGMSLQEISDSLALNNLKRRWNIFTISALTGDGITEAFDWLALQLGSSQVKQTAEINKIQTEVTHFLPPQNHPETCERSYSALACFFIRPTQAVGIHKDDDNHDGDDEKIDDV